jgi:hypothetical protein
VGCVVAVTVWIASGWVDAEGWDGRRRWVAVSAGCLGVGRDRTGLIGMGSPSWFFEATAFRLSWWFDWGSGWIEVPIWFLAVIAFAPTAAAWHLDSLARRRARCGHCPTCNYDRRGIPAASVCPECGAAPAQAST